MIWGRKKLGSLFLSSVLTFYANLHVGTIYVSSLCVEGFSLCVRFIAFWLCVSFRVKCNCLMWTSLNFVLTEICLVSRGLCVWRWVCLYWDKVRTVWWWNKIEQWAQTCTSVSHITMSHCPVRRAKRVEIWLKSEIWITFLVLQRSAEQGDGKNLWQGRLCVGTWWAIREALAMVDAFWFSDLRVEGSFLAFPHSVSQLNWFFFSFYRCTIFFWPRGIRVCLKHRDTLRIADHQCHSGVLKLMD